MRNTKMAVLIPKSSFMEVKSAGIAGQSNDASDTA